MVNTGRRAGKWLERNPDLHAVQHGAGAAARGVAPYASPEFALAH